MLKKIENKLTAAEVRELPIGSKVTLHGKDHRWYATELKCTIVQSRSGRCKVLEYQYVLAGNGYRETKPIRDYPNKYYTLDEKAPETNGGENE